LWIRPEERGVLEGGEHFRSDLIGCQLLDHATGVTLGVVEDWQEYGGPLLLQMQRNGKEVLIPFVDAICREVDVAQKRIVVDLPDGLLDL
jgi:16S rRNA processing protein RimM